MKLSNYFFLLKIMFISTLSLSAQQEDATYPMGCLIPTASNPNILAAPPLTTKSSEKLPAQHSLKAYCPTPKMQVGNSCVGWATTYYGCTMLAAHQQNWTDQAKIDQEAYSPYCIYEQIKLHKNTENEGATLYHAFVYLNNEGAVKWKDCPIKKDTIINHINTDTNPYFVDYRELPRSAKRHHGKTITTINQQTILAIKNSIYNYSPVVVAIISYHSLQDSRGSSLWNGDLGVNSNGHAVTVVGYDDNKYGGAFEIVNSWGQKWGDSGFIWIKYGDFLEIGMQAFELIARADMLVVYDDETPKEPKESNIAPLSPTPKIVENAPKESYLPPAKPVFKPEQPIVKKEKLKGSLRLVKANEKIMYAKKNHQNHYKYEITEKHKAGLQYNIYFTNESPAYVYLFGTSVGTKELALLYPFKHYSPYLSYVYSEVAIPDENHYITTQPYVGKGQLCILYSKKPLQIHYITDQLQRSSGDLSQRLTQVLGQQLVSQEDIRWKEHVIRFEATVNDQKNVVPIIIETTHQQ